MKYLKVLLITLLLCGCQTTTDINDNATITSLDALSQKADAAFIQPSDVNINNESFGIIDDTIAEYAFEIDGVACVLRQGYVGASTDISGMPSNISPNNEEDSLFPMYMKNDTYQVARWFTLDGQYTLTAKDEDTWSFETFESLCLQFQNMKPNHWTNASSFERYSALEGVYTCGELSVFVRIVQDHLRLLTGYEDMTYECDVVYSNQQFHCENLVMTSEEVKDEETIITTKTMISTSEVLPIAFENNQLIFESDYFNELKGLVFELQYPF